MAAKKDGAIGDSSAGTLVASQDEVMVDLTGNQMFAK